MFTYQISLRSVQWEPSFSVRTDGRTDMTKLIVAFSNFAKTPKNIYVFTHQIRGWNASSRSKIYKGNVKRESVWTPGSVWTGAENLAPTGFFFVFPCTLYFIPACCVLTVVHFAFLSLLPTHNTNIHVPGGIRTRNPSKRSVTDPSP
jgi:hypothetical protein